MPTYHCKIGTERGQIIEKTIIAGNKSSLKEHIEREGNFLIDVRKAEGLKAALRGGAVRRGFKTKDFMIFNQELSVLIKAGVPITSTLDAIIEKGGRDELVQLLVEIRNDISGGESLSGAFGKYSYIFSNLYIATLPACERIGNLCLAITRYIDYLKRISAIRQKIITASVYPVILTLASLFSLIFLLLYVVPAFTKTYFEAGTQLPGMTLMLINTTNAVKENFIYFVFFMLGIFFAFFYFKKTEVGRLYIDRWKLKMPFLGTIYIHYSLSKLARTLATVLRGGMPLVDSLKISSGTLNNLFLQKKLYGSTDKLQKGAGFSESLSESEAFPKLAIRMISSGEGTGSLDTVLEDLAEFYESDVDTKLSVLTSAIEPVLMIMMGLLIGVIVLSMYLPICQMAGTVG